MTVKARKVGNSLTLTIPSSFNIADGSCFEAQLNSDSSILYRPNPFEGTWYKEDMHQHDIMEDNEPLDSEWS